MGSGGKKTFKRYPKSEQTYTRTHRQTHGHFDLKKASAQRANALKSIRKVFASINIVLSSARKVLASVREVLPSVRKVLASIKRVLEEIRCQGWKVEVGLLLHVFSTYLLCYLD